MHKTIDRFCITVHALTESRQRLAPVVHQLFAGDEFADKLAAKGDETHQHPE